MRGEIHTGHIWKYKYCQIIFSLEYSRSIIAKICHVFDNGIQIEVIEATDYSSIYKKGEEIYIQSYPGMQIKFIKENKLKEYLCEH